MRTGISRPQSDGVEDTSAAEARTLGTKGSTQAILNSSGYFYICRYTHKMVRVATPKEPKKKKEK